MKSLSDLSLNTVTLQVQEMYQTFRIDRQHLINADLRIISLDFANQFELRMKARMAGQVVETHKYPLNWKEAVKERWFPKFLLKRFPVKYKLVETWHAYPTYPLPDHQTYAVQYLVVKDLF